MTNLAIQILLIEDSQPDVLLLDEVLSRDPIHSFDLRVVERLGAGLEALRKGKFDLVLLDLGLPDSQGLDTFKKLHQEFPETPVVILTGLQNDRIALEAVQSGAQDFLVKDPKTWEIASRAIRYAIERQQMQTNLRASEARYRVLFENSPVSIWEQDFSLVKAHLESLKQQGITDFKGYFCEHPHAIDKCAEMIRILDVNKAGLKMYRAERKENLIQKTPEELSPGEKKHFLESLVAIAEGKTSHGWEGADETMTGEHLEISLNWSVAPGYEEDFSKVIVTTTDITERKKVEEALRETNQTLQAIIQASPTGIIVIDAQGIVKLWSPANEKIFGWSASEAVGQMLPYVTEDKRNEHVQLRQRVLQGEAFMGIEVQRQRKDGAPVDIIISTAPLRDGQGNIIGIMGLNFDITERKRVKQALQDSETRYRLATQATNDIIWEWDPKTRQLAWSENAQLVLGYSLEEVGPDDCWWDEHIHPEDRERVVSKLNAFIEGTKTIWSGEYRFLRQDGSYAHISDHAYIERDNAGKAIRMVGAMANITEQKQAEEALRDSEMRYRSLFEDSPISLWEEDFSEVKKRLDGLRQEGITDLRAYLRDHPQFIAEYASLVKVIDVNKATLALYQAEEKQELIKSLSTIFSGESYDAFVEELVYIAAGDTPFEWEGSNLTVKGEVIDIHLTWSVVPGHEHDLSRAIVSITDITQRKRAEEALRESEERFRTLINQVSHIAIQGYGPDGTVRFWNEASEKIYGYPAEEALGKNLLELIIPQEMHTEVAQAVKNLVENGEAIPSAEFSLLHKDGSRVPVYSNHTMIETRGYGKELFCIDIDLTERKLAEDATRRRNAELTVINQIGQVLSKLAEPSDIFEAIFTGIGQVLDNRNLYIALYDQTNQQVSFPIYTINGEHRTGVDRPFGNGITEYVIRTNTPLLIKRDLAKTLSQCGINLIGDPSRSFLAVPMHVGDKVIGVIALQDYDRENIYDEHHVELLTTIAAQATVALENARLYNEVQQELAERKRAEDALRQSNELLTLFIKQSPIYAYIKEVAPTESRVLMASENFQEMIGIPGSLMVGRTMGELFPPEFAIKITADDWSVISSGQVLKLDEDLEDRNYTTIKFPITQGGKNLLAGYTMDVTERKRAEQALRASERRYRSLFEDSPISLWEEDYSEVKKRLDGLRQAGITDFRAYFKDHPQFITECASLVKIVDVNKATVDLYQAKEKAELLTNLYMILGDDSYNGFAEELIHILEGDFQFGWEGTNQTLTGERLDTSLTWSVVPGYEHDLSRVIISITDITKRKQAEEALKKSEADYRLLFNNANDVILIFEPQNETILEANDRACKTYGFGHDELVGMSLKKLTKDVASGESQLQDLLDKGTYQDFETVHFNCRGEEIHFLANSSMIEYQGRKAVLSINRDMTERKQAEETIRQNEKKFKTLFEIAPVGISVLDREHNIIDTNYALQRITGLRKNELVNGAFRKRIYMRPDGSIMPPEEFASTRALQENMPIFDVETGIVTKNRGVVWTEISAAPLDIPDASLVVITQDISERKQSEQTLRQRLVELETLYESSLSLSQLLEPKEIGQKIIDVLAEKLDWCHTAVRLFHPETDSLELLAYNIAGITSDQERRAMGERFKSLIARPGDGLSGWALQHGETVRCGNVLKDSRYIQAVSGMRSGLYVPIKTGGRATGVISIESEKPQYFTAEDEHLVATLAAQAAVALENIRLFKDLQKSNNDLFRAYDETIEGWSHALDLRDKETEGHTQRVTTLTEKLARAMGIPASEIVHIRRGALLHDIGKMGVPDRILLKPDKLTEEEWILMRQHPVHAFNLLSRIEFLRPALQIPHYHHERWDGSGYPEGRKGEQIPLEARIFAVVDVYDALTSDRPYRPAWPRDKVIQYIREQAGWYFDPQVVEVFIKLISEITWSDRCRNQNTGAPPKSGEEHTTQV